MNAQYSIDWLRPSAIEGMLRLRREMALTGENLDEVERRLNTAYANSGMDWEVARVMLSAFPDGPTEHSLVFQQVIEGVARKLLPSWLALLPRGRSFLLDALPVDLTECFRRTGALDTSPETEVVTWLDGLAALGRVERDVRLVAIGRIGERLTYELERARCDLQADAPEVEWVALNDNTAGYDVRSSEMFAGSYKAKLIEVKASTSSRKEFILTRHEWDVAQRVRNSYWVHFWDLTTDQMAELSFEQLSSHIPADCGRGRWLELRVSLE